MNNEFPYKFHLDVIKQKVDYYVERGRVSRAIELLEKIEDLWVEKKPNINDSGNDHLMSYHLKGLFLPPGINDYFLYRLGEMISQLKNGTKENQSDNHQAPKHKAKYYAFYHWLKIELGIHPLFEKDEKDNWPASEIKAFAEEYYRFNDGQSFYRSFKELHESWTNKISIAKTLKKGYKKIVGEISNQDIKIIEKLKDWPE